MTSPEHNTASWISRWARTSGDRLAVVDATQRLDYAGFERRIAQLAGWLLAAGIEPGDRVGILAHNCSATLETVFATVRVGAIALPINTRLSPPEVCFLFDDCTPRALVHSEKHRALADAACAAAVEPPSIRLEIRDPRKRGETGAYPDYEKALAHADPQPDALPVGGDAPMLLMYTSGTTGRPKGALLPHRKALYNSLNAEIYFGAGPDDRVLVATPLFHSLGLQILALPALHAGASVFLHDQFDPEAVWTAVEHEAITYLGGVPTMYDRLLATLERSEEAHSHLGSLRFLFTAGAAAPPDLVRSYRRRGLVLIQGYGQTESSTLTCLAAEDAERKAGSVGLPVHHASLRVIASDTIDGPVSDWRDVDSGEGGVSGERGEIVVRGPIVMLGYWQRPEETAATLREGWLRTGDLATRDDEGFLTLVGRSREMFISGGENVYPAEVEASYVEHPAVREIAVVGIPDPQWGEIGRAHVVLRPGTTPDEAELKAWGRARLASFKIPSTFVFEAELPKTASGKVQKHRLLGTDR